jgi:alkylated DNA repair dioxygenase AlkB
MSGRRGRLGGMNEHIDVESGDVLVAVGTARGKHAS